MTVGHMFNAWHFAKDLKLPFNRFVTIRPIIIDNLSPAERIVLWDDYKNKIAQFARDNHFEHINVWSRESTRDTGEAEHLHLLTHIPPSLQEAFADNVAKWCGDTDEIDVRPADYRLARQPSGRLHSAITYLAKNSPSAAKFRNFTYRLGGPILGKRAGWSRNLSPAAIARAEARHLIKTEFGHDRAIRSDLR
ncbi:hypothetical protein ASF34_21655 [Methylobacterium sp. Leaf106]|nr:hypothetical protein ASF34_21655 [Methylobacterium sp. Leaf106]